MCWECEVYSPSLEGRQNQHLVLLLKALQRMEERGPSERDVRRPVKIDTQFFSEGGRQADTMQYFEYYVPADVLGKIEVAQPRWGSLRRMSYREFFYGLQQRNWKSKHFDPEARPWNLQFFTCNGKGILAFDGYRVQITKADGSQWWCELPREGTEVFVQDNLRTDIVPGRDDQIEHIRQANELLKVPGYNQVFEELFQAYDQIMPPNAGNLTDAEFKVRLARERAMEHLQAQAKAGYITEEQAEAEAEKIAAAQEAAIVKEEAAIIALKSGRVLEQQLDPPDYVCPGADRLRTTFHTAAVYNPRNLLPNLTLSFSSEAALLILTVSFVALATLFGIFR